MKINKIIKMSFLVFMILFVLKNNVDARVKIYDDDNNRRKIIVSENNEYVYSAFDEEWDSIKTYDGENKVTVENEDYTVHFKAVTLLNGDTINDISDANEVVSLAKKYGITPISGINITADGLHEGKNHKWHLIVTYEIEGQYMKAQYITECNGVLYTVYVKSNDLNCDVETIVYDSASLLYEIYIGKDAERYDYIIEFLEDEFLYDSNSSNENEEEIESVLDDEPFGFDDAYGTSGATQDYTEEYNNGIQTGNFNTDNFEEKSIEEFFPIVWGYIKMNSEKPEREGMPALLIIIAINAIMFALTNFVLKTDESFNSRIKMTTGYLILVFGALIIVTGISLPLTAVLAVFYIGWTWTKTNKMPCCANPNEEDDGPEADNGPDVFVNRKRWH